MKITKKLVLLILACFLLFSSVCLATSESAVTNSENNTEENAGDSQAISIINTDIYTSNQDIVIEDVVNGNVFALGSNVTIKGEILGDLFVGADTLTIEEGAVIQNNVFAFTSTCIVKGEVYDIYAYSNSFELVSTSYVYRDLKVYAQNVTLNGLIAKDAYILASNITMPENARNLIGGNLNYTSTQEFTFPEEAVLGEIKYTPYEDDTYSVGEIITSYIINFVNTIVYVIIVIILIIFFAPKFAEKVSYVLNKRSFASAGIGIASIILIPILAIILLITGFLSYISLAILVVYGLILSITLAIFGVAIGKYIVDRLKNPSRGKFVLFSILSAIVLWLLQIIPYIGGYITLFIFVVGLGVFIFAFFIRKDVSELGKKDKKTTK